MKLKKWVVKLLIILQCINLLFLGSDCDNITLYILSKIFALFMIFMIHYIIVMFSDFFDDILR